MASSDTPAGLTQVGDRSGKGINMCVFGVPGAGKTRLIGTGKKTLIIRPPTDHTESIVLPADVQEVVVHDWDEVFSEVYPWLQQEGHKKLDWVWIDSITLFEDFGLDDVLADAIARSGNPERAAFGADKGEYGINRGRIMKWVRDMAALSDQGKFNFGVTAHPMEWWNPVEEKDIWTPMVGSPNKGNMSVKLCGYMHVVAYLRVVKRKDKPTRRVLLTDAEGFYGKDQLGAFDKIVDPTMQKVAAAIRQALKGTPRTRTKRPARKRR